MIFKIREAVEDDIPVLEIVRRQAIEAGYDDAYEQAEFAELVARPDKDLASWIREDHILVYLIETQYTPACYGVYDRIEGQVLDIFTAPEYEGKGYAGQILDRFEDVAEEDGRDVVRVAVPKNARYFFESKGYEEVGREKKDGLDVLTYKKSVNGNAGTGD